MRILFAGNKERGVACLQTLMGRGHQIAGVLVHAHAGPPAAGSVAAVAREHGLPVMAPTDPGDPQLLRAIRELAPDLTVLAGYGPIVGQTFIDIPRRGCLNLHGGKLPQYRGSSPMNWALINGETGFTISVIQVDRGVDTGPVLAERSFDIGPDDTIADLQDRANAVFPDLLADVVDEVGAGRARPRVQTQEGAGYWPLRFPDDGLIFWDEYTAQQIHNRIRALTDPYPGAFSFFGRQKLRLLRSQMTEVPTFGEPGRVYRTSANGLLVCAKDRCLWIRRAVFDHNGEDAMPAVARYEKFATLRDAVARAIAAGALS
jgi:methionyl-tRNA formyltransferase